jgi:lysophospholipid acyltransferase (LPLAT)-like uncharacterized protein
MDKIKQIYQPADLSAYSFRERFLIRAADWSFYSLISLIGRTVKFEIEGWENFEAIEKAGKVPIYAFWHNRIFLGTYFFRQRGIVVMTSQSFDGEYIARFIQRFGYGAARGSSTRGGMTALVEMIRLMREGLPMGFTVDGPKGPKYAAKMGAILLAKKTGNPIMPFSIAAEKFWEAKSWDKLQIPKPFSPALVTIATPIYVPEKADETILNAKLAELQSVLDKLTERGEQWRN